MTIQQLIDYIESAAPRAWQESWDNSGIQAGDTSLECTGVLLTLDVTEESVRQAKNEGLNLIVSHHPLLFKGIKKLTRATAVERILSDALKNDLTIYSAHTNMDAAPGGVNFALAETIGLQNVAVLVPRADDLVKLVTYTPESHAEGVSQAIFEAGAGTIGAYDRCSFYHPGTGTFRPGEGTEPYVGEKNQTHREPEIRSETIVPRHLLAGILSAMRREHPYETPAYDVYPLEVDNPAVGLGCIGELTEPLSTGDFFRLLTEKLGTPSLRHSVITRKTIRKVALCGGSGIEFLPYAIAARADIYLTGDLKYHDFQRAEGRLILIDGGHYETEAPVLETFCKLISKKFPNFAVRRQRESSNPVHYYQP